MGLKTLTLVDTYQFCLWAEHKYGMGNSEWHEKIWRSDNGLCDYMEGSTYITFEKTDEPTSLLEEHVNDFLDDYSELGGKVSFIFTN